MSDAKAWLCWNLKHSACIDINLNWLSSCSVVKEKEHIRIKLTRKAWQILDKLTVILSKYIMRHVFNWRVVC